MKSFEAERSVLGSVLLQPDLSEHIEELPECLFVDECNSRIFRAMKTLCAERKPIDYINIYNEAKKHGKVDVAAINDTMNAVPYATHESVLSHISVLKETHTRRQITAICHEALSKVGSEDPNSLKATIASKLDNISEDSTSEGDDIGSILMRFYEHLEKKKDPAELELYKYGIKELDDLTAGLHKEETTTIAARPGVGKTAFALQIAKRLGSKGLKVLFISREMSDIQVAGRLLSSLTGINSMKFRNRDLSEDDWSELLKAIAHLKQMNVYINTKIKSVPGIKNRARKIKADVVIVDYLQLLNPDDSKDSREQQVSKMSRELKNMSLDFKIPVIQLSQLSRNAQGKRPTMADLRESGAIEQDSNNIIFLHEPNAEEVKEIVDAGTLSLENIKSMMEANIKLVNIILEKQRDGARGELLQAYIGDRLTFAPISGWH